jgi:hypothetical protein
VFVTRRALFAEKVQSVITCLVVRFAGGCVLPRVEESRRNGDRILDLA